MMKKLLMAIAVMATSLASFAQEASDVTKCENTLYMDKLTLKAGSTGNIVPVNLKNPTFGTQTVGCYITMPEGLSVDKNKRTGKPLIVLPASDDRLDNTTHSIASNYVAPDYRVGLLQTAGFEIAGTDGEIFNMSISVDESMAEGDYLIKIHEQELSNRVGKLNIDPFYVALTITNETAVKGVSADNDKIASVRKVAKKGKIVIIKADGSEVGINGAAIK